MNQKTDFSNLHYKRIIKTDENELKSFEIDNLHFKKDYSYTDVENLEQIDSFPGFYPFLRGATTTGNVLKPWLINQSSNYFHQEKSTYNLDNYTIQSTDDMFSLLENVSLEEVCTSQINKKALINLAYFVAAIENKGIDKKKLFGTFSYNAYKNECNTISSRRIITDIIEYTTNNIPHFNTISISDENNLEESSINKVAKALAIGYQILQNGIEKGLKIDTIAPLLSFSFSTDEDFSTEVSKLRAARMVWAKLIQEFSPQNYDSYQLKIHSIVTENDTTNFNQTISKVTNQALATVLGGIDSLNTKLKNSNEISSEDINRISNNIQLVLQDETQICRTVDPLGGSFFIESFTNEIAIELYQKIKENSSFKVKEETNELVIEPTNSYLKELRNAILTKEGNLLELTVNAIKNNATYNDIYSIIDHL